jgi:3-dehydroquinate synthase
MSTLEVTHPTGRYPIHVWNTALSDTGRLLRESGLSGKVAIITNGTVDALYGRQVLSSLADAGFEAFVYRVPDGESFKTLSTVSTVYDRLIEHELDRNSTIVALGGGVMGDMAGFAAATYLRGVPLVQVPTTLLAMIDASLGGKVAVDHRRGKNLIGAFHQPTLVITDPDVLSTLPPVELRAGVAEVIKHGLISAPDLFEHLEQNGADPIEWIVERAIAVKVEIIQEDPYERGRRAVLNLGHTFAHAFEAVSDFRLRHGEAVGVGLVAAARTARAMGLCSGDVEERVVALLERFNTPTGLPEYQPKMIRAAMSMDKKRRGRRLRFILPESVGTVSIRDDVPEEVIDDVLASVSGQ